MLRLYNYKSTVFGVIREIHYVKFISRDNHHYSDSWVFAPDAVGRIIPPSSIYRAIPALYNVARYTSLLNCGCYNDVYRNSQEKKAPLYCAKAKS